jgi:dTDP-4-dehydrorhamnose reductase
MKKVIVTGASGLLGSNIIFKALNKYKTIGLDIIDNPFFSNVKYLNIDLVQKNQLKIIEKEKPDLIINCAAFVNVDGCEKDPEKAYLSNVVTTKNITELCSKINCFLIHISTDSVFDGKKGNYSEKDKTNPINVYGKTKLEAEKVIEQNDIDYCITRTNIYGWNKQDKFSLAEWMINKLENNNELPAFFDTIFTPILVNNLIYALFEIYEKNITGIVHLAGSESCSKYHFAKLISEIFDFNTDLVKKISISELNLPAKRGKNLSLNTFNAQNILDTKLLNVRQGLEKMNEIKQQGYVKKLKGL